MSAFATKIVCGLDFYLTGLKIASFYLYLSMIRQGILIYTMMEIQVKNVIADDIDEWMLHSQTIAMIMLNRMEQFGMTQKALAMKMNCSQQYISKVLKGRENMSLETLCKIEKALDVKIVNSNNE